MDVKNLDLYNKTIDVSLFNVCLKIVDITNYYILYSFEGSFKDTTITQKGVDVILNVFAMILLYTKNLELAIEYTNNSIYYFIEYVTQISTTNTEFVFVNLTIKDAILYVYRKSIFEINDNHKRNFKCNPDETLYFEIVNSFIKTYTVILKSFITNKNYIKSDIEDIKVHIYKINSYILTFFKTIEMYTDIELTDNKTISISDKNIIYNVTYKGIEYIYDNFNCDCNNASSPKNICEDKESYDCLCEKIKKLIIDYGSTLIESEI
jgi:hypothetical protein